MSKKIPLLIIVGPTGIGKSRLAQELALRLSTAVIHADSRQVYKYMDIGTAKPDEKMRREVPHYLLDVVEPDEAFNAGEYKRLATPIIERLYGEEKKLPLIEGGTGLYVRALVDGLFDGPVADAQIRERLQRLSREKGIEYLHRQLARIDPVSANRLHPNDYSRIVRALEVFELTGHPLSAIQQDMPPSPYRAVFFGLVAERELLYQWIDERAEQMLQAGFVEEVRRLLEQGYNEGLNSMQGLGYRQMAGFLKGEYDLEQAVHLLKRDTRRYAKRQLTWFRQDKRIQWLRVIDPRQTDRLAPEIISALEPLQFPAG